MHLILWEIASYVVVIGVWFSFRFFLKRNITGDMIAGSILGFFLEFSTEPICDYHFKLTVYKDLPLVVVLAWGMMFAVTVWLSEKLYYHFLKTTAIRPADKRIFLFDVMAGVLIGFPLETVGAWTGAWTYNYAKIGWNLGFIPGIHMPLEALIGYGLIMLVGPTYVRHWQAAFEGRP